MHFGPTGDLCEFKNDYNKAKLQLHLTTVLETGPRGELRIWDLVLEKKPAWSPPDNP